MKTHLLLLCFLGFCSTFTYAENWPRYRGPNGSGVSGESGLPLSWSEKEHLKWKRDLPGPGSSSPIVWGDKVFITSYSGYGNNTGTGTLEDLKRHLLCLSTLDGSVVWEKTLPAPQPEDPYDGFIGEHGYASHTPTTDGERVYAYFGKGGLVVFDLEGRELWRKNLGSRSSSRGWGTSSSPLLHDDFVIVNANEESNTIYAFHKATGEEAWRWAADGFTSVYGTPVIASVGGRDDLVVGVTGEIWGMNPATGKLRWFAQTRLTGNLSPSPVIAGERVIQFGGYPSTMGAAVTLGGKGDVTSTNLLWQNNQAKSYLTSPVFHEGRLYWVTDAGIACCADPATGKLIYEERLEGSSGQGGRGKPFYASPILVDGHVLATSRTAGTFVIAAKPEFSLVRVNRIAGDETRFQGTPAVSGGHLFLRSDQAIYCIGN